MAANGIEVASTYVTILAKMPGLTASVDKALGRVDVGGVSKKIGQQVADSVGKSLKDQVAKKFADATAAAMEKSTAAVKRLADAEHALLKARAQHGTSAARVAAAEGKIESVRQKLAQYSSDVRRSESDLDRARADAVASAGRLERAEQGLERVRRDGGSASDVREAEAQVAKLRKASEQAAAGVEAAEKNLEKVRASGTSTSAELEKAEAALTKAQADQAGTSRAVAEEQLRVAEAKGRATEASKEYADALAKEQSKSEQALAWMSLANARIDEISGKWKAAGEKIGGVGASLTSKFTKPATIAAGAVTGLVTALGFKRLVGIDTARGQFKGLGMDADAVMAQVDRGVTNTSLSMAQGASLAVGILATGTVPLEGLEAQIKRVSNVSAAYGVEAEHAAYLLNNVLTKNKVTWGDLSQMQQNQIPIVTQLADYYGVAGDEIMKMAQDGQISVEDLNKVLDQNAGAAAEEYANTWQGVTANILSNIGRIGAKFLEPSFELMKDEAAEFLDFLKTDEFSTIATEMGDRIAGMVTTVSEKIQDLVSWWNELSGGQKRFIGVAAGVLVAAGPVLTIVGKLVSAVGLLISAAKLLLLPFKAIPAVWGAAKLAQSGWNAAAVGGAGVTKALTGATKGQTAAMKIGAATQRVFNAAMKANPIGLIITAITALVAGLVWFFTKTELGQKIWGEFSRFLGEAWANITGFFTAAYENVIKPVFEGIKNGVKAVGDFFVTVWTDHIKPVFDGIAQAAKWVWETILNPVFDFIAFSFAIMAGLVVGTYEALIKPMIDAFGRGLSWLNDNVVQPVMDAIGAAFTWVSENVIAPVVTAIKAYIDAWGRIFKWLWEKAIKPALDAIGRALVWIRDNVIKPVVDAIVAYFKAWGEIFKWLWERAIKPALDAIGNAFRWLWDSVIKPVWDGIYGTIQSVWNKIKTVIDTMVRIVRSDPKKAFEAARDGIKTAWNAIKEIAKKPVRFVVETVFGGLVGAVNKFLPKSMKLPLPKLPPGFSEGGYTGNIAANAVAGVVHGNEHVIKASSRRSIESRHPGLLDHMNRTGTIPGYKKGGLVHPLPGSVITTQWMGYPGHTGMDFAKPQGTPIQAAAAGVVSKQFYHHNYGNMVDLNHGGGFSTRYAHMLANVAVRLGQVVKAGQVVGYEGSTGNSTGPHLHFETLQNGSPMNPAPFLSGAASVKPAFGIVEGLLEGALSKFKGAFPEGGFFVDAAGAVMKSGVKGAVDWISEKLSFGVGGGGLVPTLYDNGGWLQPGLSLVQNKTGRPEPIFTGDEFDRMVAGNGGIESGTRLVLVLDDGTELGGYVERRAGHVVDRKLAPVSAGALASSHGRRS